jgi:hypothetical protein
MKKLLNKNSKKLETEKYLRTLSDIQENFNKNMAQITFRDVIIEARSVPVFDGSDTYSLYSFIKEVESLLDILTEDTQKNYVTRILLGKIQGPAAAAVRRLDSTTWNDIKEQLIKCFGVTESYLDLKEKADNINSKNVSELYHSLSNILDKLNHKYQLDEEKPIEFQPKHNEISILNKFLNKINRVDAMFVRTSQIKTLEEAFQALKNTGITLSDPQRNSNSPRASNSSTKNYNPNFKRNFQSNSNQTSGGNTRSYFNYNRNNNHNFHNNNNYNNNYNRNYNNHNFHNNNNHNNNYNRNSNNSGTFSRNNRQNNYNNNYTYNQRNQQSAPEPMEVDNIDLNITENFHPSPQTPHYP